MDFNDFGENLEDSTIFLIEKLKELHPWDQEWHYNVAVKLVPIYNEEMIKFQEILDSKDLEFESQHFNKLIRFSSILSKDQVKILFLGDLADYHVLLGWTETDHEWNNVPRTWFQYHMALYHYDNKGRFA